MAGLMSAGYVHQGRAKCSGCPMTIEWYLTPKNKRMPFSLKVGMNTQYEPHWGSCASADRFRKTKKDAPKIQT
jgi:hypothetical protein